MNQWTSADGITFTTGGEDLSPERRAELEVQFRRLLDKHEAETAVEKPQRGGHLRAVPDLPNE